MRILITGSDSITDHNTIISCIERSNLQIHELVTCQSKGIDSVAELWAGDRGLPVTQIYAKWYDLTASPLEIKLSKSKVRYNALAGYIRNKEIVNYVDEILVIRTLSKDELLDDLISRAIVSKVKVMQITLRPKSSGVSYKDPNGNLIIYTGYFSKLEHYQSFGLIPINIALGSPSNIGDKIPHYYKLAPGRELINEYKYGSHKDDRIYYIENYLKNTLSKVTIQEVLSDLFSITNNRNPILLCWEGSNKFCHRLLVSEWLKKNGYTSEEYI